MFYQCYRFNGDVSGWTIEQAYSLSNCFYNASYFKGKGLSSWTVKDGYSSKTQWPPIIPTSSYKYFYKFDFSGLTFDGSSSYDITDSNYGSFDINNTLFLGSTPRSVYIENIKLTAGLDSNIFCIYWNRHRLSIVCNWTKLIAKNMGRDIWRRRYAI